MIGVQGQGEDQIFQGLVGQAGVHADDGLFILVLRIAFMLGGQLLLGRRASRGQSGDHQKRTESVFHANLKRMMTSPPL